MTAVFFIVFLFQMPLPAAALCALWCGALHSLTLDVRPVPVVDGFHVRPARGWEVA